MSLPTSHYQAAYTHTPGDKAEKALGVLKLYANYEKQIDNSWKEPSFFSVSLRKLTHLAAVQRTIAACSLALTAADVARKAYAEVIASGKPLTLNGDLDRALRVINAQVNVPEVAYYRTIAVNPSLSMFKMTLTLLDQFTKDVPENDQAVKMQQLVAEYIEIATKASRKTMSNFSSSKALFQNFVKFLVMKGEGDFNSSAALKAANAEIENTPSLKLVFDLAQWFENKGKALPTFSQAPAQVPAMQADAQSQSDDKPASDASSSEQEVPQEYNLQAELADRLESRGVYN